MTIPRYLVLHEYWANRPPIHVIQAARFMEKPKRQNTSEEFEAAVRAMSSGG